MGGSVRFGVYIMNKLPNSRRDPSDFSLRVGRAIFEEPSLSLANKLPIMETLGYVTKGYKAEPPESLEKLPITLSEAGIQYMTDGGIVLLHWKEKGWSPLYYLIYVSGSLILQDLSYEEEAPGGIRVIREIKKSGDKWILRQCTGYGTPARSDIGEPLEISSLDIVVIPNDVSPSGMLEPAQLTYYRIEEIDHTMKENQNPNAKDTFFKGMMVNIKQLNNELAKPGRFGAIKSDVDISQLQPAAQNAQLMREQEQKLMIFLRMLRVPGTVSNLQRTSGEALRLTMTPQTEFVEMIRGALIKYAARFDVNIVFARVRIEDANTRRVNFDLIASSIELLGRYGITLEAEEIERRVMENL